MNYLVFAGLVLIIELISFFVVFKILARLYLLDDDSSPPGVNATDFFKGAFERFVLFFALFHNLPQALIFFGAIKVATRLKSKSDSDSFNNFFLIGNLYSIFLAILYSNALSPDGLWVGLIVDFALVTINQ